jgi:hypothetical protein
MKTWSVKYIKLLKLSLLLHSREGLPNKVSNKEKRFKADFEEKAEA